MRCVNARRQLIRIPSNDRKQWCLMEYREIRKAAPILNNRNFYGLIWSAKSKCDQGTRRLTDSLLRTLGRAFQGAVHLASH